MTQRCFNFAGRGSGKHYAARETPARRASRFDLRTPDKMQPMDEGRATRYQADECGADQDGRLRKIMRNVLNAILVVLCSSIGLAASVMAEQLQDWEAAYRRNDFTTAYRLLLPLADGGDVNAQYSRGVMLRDGRGVPQNPAEAAVWFRKAAGQGAAKAQYNLG